MNFKHIDGEGEKISNLSVCKTSEDTLVLGRLQTFAFDSLFKKLLFFSLFLYLYLFFDSRKEAVIFLSEK